MAGATTVERSGPLRLRASQVFDGYKFLGSTEIVVDGSSIVSVGEPRDDLECVDLGDLTLLPGFVDCHQHLVFDGNGTLEEQVSGFSDEALLERARDAARTALIGGVTTLRDLGDRAFVTLELRGDPDLPTIVCAGPPITTPHGHCWYLGSECDGTGDLRRAVAERIEHGTDLVKIMVTGGVMTPATPPWQSQFVLDELRQVVDDAHSAGLPVAAHCHGLGGIADAVAVGIDTIEHCSFLDDELKAAPSEELLTSLARSGTAISATFGRLPDAPPLAPELMDRRLGIRAAIGAVHGMGGAVVLGSDAGIAPAKPHDVAPHAMKDFLGLGMDTAEALRSMTSLGAEVLGLESKGRLLTGADADFVAVRGDVAKEPMAVADIVGVWRAGRQISR